MYSMDFLSVVRVSYDVYERLDLFYGHLAVSSTRVPECCLSKLLGGDNYPCYRQAAAIQLSLASVGLMSFVS